MLKHTRENLLRFWDYDKNHEFNPEEISLFSTTKLHFLCENRHSWINKVINQSSNKNCQGCLKLYFKFPFLEEHWDYEKNTVSFEEVYASSSLKVHWKCPECKGETINKIHDKVNMTECFYCSNKRLLKGLNDLATKNPELLIEWDYKRNKIAPEEILFNSGSQVWWNCQFNHSFKTAVRNRTMRRFGCRTCKVSTEPEIVKLHVFEKYGIDEKWLLENYVNSSMSMDDIFEKFKISPTVLRKSLKAYDLKKDSIAIRTHKNHKRFQTNMKKYGEFNPGAFAVSPSKYEREIFSILINVLKLNVVQNDRTIISPKELDLWLPELSMALEFNGNYWHDKKAWLSDVEQGTFKTREAVKSKLCFEKNIKLVHIWEDDWIKLGSEIDKIAYVKSILSIV